MLEKGAFYWGARRLRSLKNNNLLFDQSGFYQMNIASETIEIYEKVVIINGQEL